MNTTVTGHRTFQEGASAEASNRLFSYSGRIGRTRFFWTCVTLASADSIVAWFVSHLDGGTNLNMWAWAIALVIGLNTYIGICAGIKRCHDLGRSGTFYFWVFIPVVGIFPFLLLLFTEGTQHANSYGPARSGGSNSPAEAEPVRRLEVHTTGASSPQQMESACQFDEDAAFLIIANEIDSKSMDRGLWLKALVKSGGADLKHQTIAYTELRLHQLRNVPEVTLDSNGQVAKYDSGESSAVPIESSSSDEPMQDSVLNDVASKASIDDVDSWTPSLLLLLGIVSAILVLIVLSNG